MSDENYKHREIRVSVDKITDIDFCNECDEERKIVSCDKCANAVCTNYKCSLLFPHRNGSVYAVCNTCRVEIESKLKLFVDLDKLKLLKRKIKKRMLNKLGH